MLNSIDDTRARGVFRAAPLRLAVCMVFCSVSLSAWAKEQDSKVQSGIHTVSLSASPLIPTSAQGDRQILILTIDSGGLSEATLRLTSKAWPQPQTKSLTTLPAGNQSVRLEVPPLAEPAMVTVQIEASGTQRSFGPFSLQPPRRWTVYLNQHTHTDIGYTRPQTEILPEHLRYIDYALDYCDLTDGYPDDARFRWTCETSWAVREYFKGRPDAQIERLKRRLAEGRIEICGLMLNMSDMAGESELAALLRPLRALKEEHGISVRTAMQNDVNGAGWCLPDYFSSIGIRYLTMGINKTRSLLPFDKPTCFWWESPSGKRVLAFRADHYNTANFWGIEKGEQERFQPQVEQYLLSLEQRGYPFDRVGVQFSGYFTDNSPPSTMACDLVKNWNRHYAWPKLRLSTAQEFLAWVEKEHSGQLPVHRQAWPDWWTDGFGSAARETAAARQTQSAIQTTNGLLAMASLLGASIKPQTMDREAALLDDLLFYDEHTYGAAESISDPLAENAQVQWGEKASYVWTAVKNSAQLREEAFGLVQNLLPRSEVPTLAVFNTLNWPRSGMVRVFIDHQMLPTEHEFRILDGTQPVPAQALESRTEGTYWAIWVNDVPPLGFKLLRLETSEKPRIKPDSGADSSVLENAFYRLQVDDQRGGLSSLVDKETGAELVDPALVWALGQCIYETMPANREMKPGLFKRTTLRHIKVQPGAGGPIWKSLLLTAEMDGCAATKGFHMEVHLYETEKRLELHFALRKLPVPSPESVYVAFPFQWPLGELRYEAQGGSLVPGKEQLPGSSSDWQSIQSFVSLRNGAGQMIIGSDQVPLVQLGDFNLGKWQPVTRVEKPHVFSWVMNNYWFTNFRTEQEGEFKWSYYLTSTVDKSLTAATRFGWGSRIPLAARVLPPVKNQPVREVQPLSTLRLKAQNLLLVEARPTRGGEGVLLHLRETEGNTAQVTLEELAAQSRIRRIDEVNVLEQPLQEEVQSITFKPYESRFVRLVIR